MSLIHVSKKKINTLGRETWELYAPSGERLILFSEFCRRINGLAATSRRRYSTVASRFIDYLYELRILGAALPSRAAVNQAIEQYLSLLRDGEEICLAIDRNGKHYYEKGSENRESELKSLAKRLSITALSKNSWANTLAALNHLLQTSHILEQESREILQSKLSLPKNSISSDNLLHLPMLDQLSGETHFSAAEVNHIRSSTILGGVIRFRGEKLTRPRGIRLSARQTTQIDVDSLDFPEEYFPALVAAATSERDKARWNLSMGSGIRRSEGLNLQWCDIDFEEREVYILDPELRRYGSDIGKREREMRFKGRTVSRTYIRQPYRDRFFEHLIKYRQTEYCLPADDNEYVFQYLIPPHLGRPLNEATDTSLNDAFKSAVMRANIPGPKIFPKHIWTEHSLRHSFGNHMSNNFRIPGQQEPGVSEVELQMLLGHKDIKSTRRYSRRDHERLKRKLKAHDMQYIEV